MGLFKRYSPPASPPVPARTTASLQATPFLPHTVAARIDRNRAGSLSTSMASGPYALYDNVGQNARDETTSSSALPTPAATTLAGRIIIHDIHSSQPVAVTTAAKPSSLLVISVNASKGLVTTAQENIILQDDIARQRYNSMNVRSPQESLKRHYVSEVRLALYPAPAELLLADHAHTSYALSYCRIPEVSNCPQSLL
jgi:hypothetical protein